ncbi:MAG TPA: proline--tRNA ligase, partial [Acidimicrobiaceae bacterium]|nr:proline--tRNA ligase [Acidimicrobiaceae bacterium]
LKGVPLRVELGPRDLESGEVTLARRDESGKVAVPLSGLGARCADLLVEIQSAMLAAATAMRESRTVSVSTVADAVAASQDGFARIEWAALGENGEAELRKEAITVRCLVDENGEVASSEDAPGNIAYVGRSY